MKICAICNESKELSKFRTSTQTPDKYERICKTCRKPSKREEKTHRGCIACKRTLLKEEFNFSNKERGWRSSFCKDCSNNRRSKHAHKLTDEQRRQRHLRKRFKINLEDYNRMLAEQNNKCKICNIVEHTNIKPLSVDHDHKSLKIRGLLCTNCNTAIGHFKDNTEILQKAILYLEENQTKAI